MFACDYGKQVDVSFQFAYNNLHWVSDRYPMNFNAEHILTIESMVHGWRRLFKQSIVYRIIFGYQLHITPSNRQ
uniref:Uncharacterized protein n=1 Tax=Acrobeloides nanus TaxID=290746 RepID=A0A914DW20_9BILA